MKAFQQKKVVDGYKMQKNDQNLFTQLREMTCRQRQKTPEP